MVRGFHARIGRGGRGCKGTLLDSSTFDQYFLVSMWFTNAFGPDILISLGS